LNQKLDRYHIELIDKAKINDITDIHEKMRMFAKTTNLKSLEEKLEPQVEFVLKKMEEFENTIKKHQINLQRFDDIILDKANKYDIIVLNKRLDKCLLIEQFDLKINYLETTNIRYCEKFEQFS